MKIAPSVLTADFTNLKAEIHSIKDADIIHIDIMDGNFVPNISFGPAITRQINDVAIPNLDVHLMVLNPLDWITKFAFDKVEFITVHYERSEERRVGKSVDLGGRRIIKKKKEIHKDDEMIR